MDMDQGSQENNHLSVEDDPTVVPKDLMEFIGACQNSGVGRNLSSTHYSIGCASGGSWRRDIFDTPILQRGDEIFTIDIARMLFVLRRIGNEHYKIVNVCYLWTAMELDCWNPGAKEG
jgi:hypothetical protein